MSDLSTNVVLAVLGIFYDEQHHKDASDLLDEAALFEWAGGPGRAYLRSQGMMTLPDGRALAFDPDGRAQRLMDAGMRARSNKHVAR
jgi:hypothetical protein